MPRTGSTIEQNSIIQPYANLYWPVHCQKVASNQLTEDLRKKLTNFLFQDCDAVPSFARWVSVASELSQDLAWNNPLRVQLEAVWSVPPTPLFLACSFGLVSVVDDLSSRANVDWSLRNEEARTGLHIAAANGHEAVVKLLLEKDVDVDSKDRSGRTPLSWAAENGHEPIVRLLVDHGGIDVNSKDTSNGQTPLSWAAENGQEAVVRRLIKCEGVDVNSKPNNYDPTVPFSGIPLDAKINSHGRTPLSWAAKNGHEAVMRLLVEREDVDTDSKDNNNRTPLSWAAENGHETVVRLLIERKNVDTDSKDNNGRTPLSWAAENGHKAVVKLLLEKAVDVDSKYRSGRTPLSWARGKGREAVMKLLVEKGADVDTGSDVIGPRDFPEEYPASPRNRPKIWRTVEYL
jgi:ankyrin repeat protein